jgi:hypothetical protein
MEAQACEASNNSPSWGVMDVLRWKAWPERLGGGRGYIQQWKDAWVRHNRTHIREVALRHGFPAEVLAGVCWIEAGGDPVLIDRVAFEVRSFDWSGPDWMDRHMTVTHPPARTSFGAVSMQLRTAAQTLGMNPATTTQDDLRTLARCLEHDVFNIDLVGRHLRQLIDLDGMQMHRPALSVPAIRVLGARYNRGASLTLKQIATNTSYGDFIVRNLRRFSTLVQ